jgi:hypothetical protein
MQKELAHQRMCHYTRMESALNILSEKKLRLNKISKTNDPRESRPLEFLTFQDFGQQKNPDVDKVNAVIRNDIPRVIMEEWKVSCFTLDSLIQNDTTEESLIRMHAAFLAPGYARPRMWAQYADNHKGICLLFDKNTIDTKMQQTFADRCFSGQVAYDGEIFVSLSLFPPPATALITDLKNLRAVDAARKYVFDHHVALFLRKNPDWAHETEYRWLIHSTVQEVEGISIDGAIQAVLLGVDFPKIYEPSIIPLCKELRIPAKRILWHNGIPKTEFETIYEPKP